MKKLLTVAVPTYNRHEDLKILAESFLRPAAIIDDVEVLVCDNSDATVAERNRLLFQDTRIRYIHNGQNLGYDGNLIRCLENAKGEWIWFIPDSDEMYLDAFRDFVFFLREGGSQEYRAILIPSNSVSDRSRVQVGLEPEAIFTCDHEDDWEKSRTPREMLSRTGRLPFVSFSSVAIRLDNDSRAKARDIYK
ncbi:MAG: glycosyltransferase family 2 protein, partial [Methanobacteriota archaeon]